MAPDQKNDAKNLASYRKVAQLRAAIREDFDIEFLENILQKEGNINYEISDSKNSISTGADSGLLHFAYDITSFQVFNLLLTHGADVTAKDIKGHTVVHKIIYKQYHTHDAAHDDFENPIVDTIISAHVKFANHSNPCCNNNISHFHVACMRNIAEAVDFFLKNGVDANHAVNLDSPIFAGYTPLHFAVEFSCIQTVEILLNYGVSVWLKNAEGVNPLEILLERKMNGRIYENKDSDENILQLLAKYAVNNNKNVDDCGLYDLHVTCMIKDTSVAKSILEKITDNNLIDRPVHISSPICPGYSPLHFAALFNVETVKLLIDKGGDLEAKDAKGETPFDICLRTLRVEEIHHIISNQVKWKNIKLSDDKTKLVDLISVMTDAEELGKFLSNFESICDLIVPIDSPLWPGYTILHLAVVFSEKAKREPNYYGYSSDTKKVEECINRGAEITKADAKSSTALHLAFYLQKFRTVEILLKHHLTPENPFDSNNLSHFHIACAARVESAVERFLSNGVDANIPIASTFNWHVLFHPRSDCKPRYLFLVPGTTALHINVACGNIDITRMLMENGADIYAKDVNGLTPIHRLLTSCITRLEEGIDGYLLATDGLQDRISEGGLSHLHVACRFDNYNAVEKLLDAGADINAVVTSNAIHEYFEDDDYFYDSYGDPSKKSFSFLSRYSGFTPLHFCIREYNLQIQKLLIQRGADVFAGNPDKCVPLKEIFSDEHKYDDVLWSVLTNSDALKNHLKVNLGLTMLHIGCYTNNFEWVSGSLLDGEDVNARVNEKSPIWPGCTPLHVATRNVSNVRDEPVFIGIITRLLKNGADVRLKDKNGDTPLHLISSRLFDEPLVRCEYARLVLESLKDFDVAEAHSQEMSFFHFACLMKNVSIVEAFLKNGIDVNRPVDLFANQYAGCSPLHLVVTQGSKGSVSQSRIVELLLKHEADVRVKDVYENTLLHTAAGYGSSRQVLFEEFISHGVEVNAENIRGETALEVLIKSGNANWLEVECLLKHGSCINSFNSITRLGYIARIISNSMNHDWKVASDEILRNLIDSEHASDVDNEGRTVLHNLVSINRVDIANYEEFIGRLVKRGCDVNGQDKDGRTALHTATWFRNRRGVLGLMRNGADVNITDKQGRTAFTYSFEPPHGNTFENHSDPNHVINTFAMHVFKMERCGLYISEINKRLQIDALEMYYLDENVLERFDSNIRKSKDIKMGSTTLTLHDFGFKINAEMTYPSMALSDRLEIDQFFKDIRRHNLHELDYLLKIKYESAVKRLRLINLAVEPFMTLIKNQLPDLCCRVILSFLSSSDLNNVIALEDL